MFHRRDPPDSGFDVLRLGTQSPDRAVRGQVTWADHPLDGRKSDKMSNIRQASEDAYETENPLYEYDRTILSEQIATIAMALADDEVRALDILLEATAIHYTDWFYEGDLDIDLGFIVSEVGSRFLGQAEYHDEIGLYRGRYIPDDEMRYDPSSLDGSDRGCAPLPRMRRHLLRPYRDDPETRIRGRSHPAHPDREGARCRETVN